MSKQHKCTVGALATVVLFAGSMTAVHADTAAAEVEVTNKATQIATQPEAEAATAQPAGQTKATEELKELSWGDLMPPINDDIVNQYHEGKLSREQAMEYMQSLEQTPVQSFHNQRVEIPGYLVPLDMDEDSKAKELLLVPTMGACIHVPPPPPNQTIFIHYDEGIEVTEAGYTPYLLTGILQVEKNNSEYTDTLYTLKVESVEEWE